MIRIFLIITFLLSLSVTAFAETSPRHGYVNNPQSRTYLCSSKGGNLNKMCGPVQYEPQSIEGPKGFPTEGPKDGEIASAGNSSFSQLNEQSATRWHKVDVASGQNTFSWLLTALHATSSWQFFITKQDWDQNSPLTRADFDLVPFCERLDNGQNPTNNVDITCNVPKRSGYQVILAVWTISNTPNAFYQVIDANMKH